MPFRRYFERKGMRHPIAYNRLTMALAIVACMAISIVVSVQASERSRQESDARARSAVCAVADRMVKVYASPETQTGREAGQAWQTLRMLFRCQGGTP
jgi:sensor domain CHASE-containing protein